MVPEESSAERIQFHPPDPAAMQELLEDHPRDTVGVVLRLAWNAGLKRREISDLTWPEADFGAGLLHVKGRDTPMDADLFACLKEWRETCEAEKRSHYVISSERRRGKMAEQSISRMVRAALDSVGQRETSLEDLRQDFVRRQLQCHDWPYVLRIAGISVSTYRNNPARFSDVPASAAFSGTPEPLPLSDRDAGGEKEKLRRLMEREGGSPAGLALRFSTQLGLRNEEIVHLTWDAVDFENGRLRLPDRESPIPLPDELAQLLRQEWEERAPGEDPHLLLTVQSRKPMTAEWLNTVTRSALIRGGIESRSLGELRLNRQILDEKRRLTEYAAAHGSITRGEAMRLLGVSEGVAYYRLKTLAEGGELVRVNFRYYPTGLVVRPEEQRETICNYLAESGPAYLQEIADLLHTGKGTTARLLRAMVDAGTLVLIPRSKRYALPEDVRNA